MHTHREPKFMNTLTPTNIYTQIISKYINDIQLGEKEWEKKKTITGYRFKAYYYVLIHIQRKKQQPDIHKQTQKVSTG